MKDLLLHNIKEKLESEKQQGDSSEPSVLIQDSTIEALVYFCETNTELATAIISSGKTFSECCKSITSDAKKGEGFSDFKVYSRAVKFYNSELDVEFTMKITSPKTEYTNISLTDLLEI